VRADAEVVLERGDRLLEAARRIVSQQPGGMRTRIHGDYHLGQLLFTGRDFVVVDFEGEPERAISERRLKRSPLRDAGGLVASLHYAASAALSAGAIRAEDVPALRPWARWWTFWTGVAFVETYRRALADTGLLPDDPESVGLLLRHFLVDKALYQLRFELRHRPAWVGIPLEELRVVAEEVG